MARSPKSTNRSSRPPSASTYRAMTSKDVTSPCSICEIRAMLTPSAAARSFSKSAERVGSKAKMILISDRPLEPAQLLEVMDPGFLEPVHKRPAERGAVLAQRRDRLGQQGR